MTGSAGGYGVLGDAIALTGNAIGVYGTAHSTSGRGIYGYARAESGATKGVSGLARSDAGVAVHGHASADTGATKGVYGHANSPAGYGVYGSNAEITGAAGMALYGSGRLKVTGRSYLGTPNSVPVAADLNNGSISFYLDQAANNLKVRVKYSTGVLKTATIALT